MAHKKGAGSSRNGRDSPGQRLGLKCNDGEFVLAGSILVRQRGTKILAGTHVGVGRDHTLYALKSGTVSYGQVKTDRTRVSVRAVPYVQLAELMGENAETAQGSS